MASLLSPTPSEIIFNPLRFMCSIIPHIHIIVNNFMQHAQQGTKVTKKTAIAPHVCRNERNICTAQKPYAGALRLTALILIAQNFIGKFSDAARVLLFAAL